MSLVAGLLAEPGDLAGLVSALRRLAEDEELRTRLGAAAQQRAATFPTWDQPPGVSSLRFARRLAGRRTAVIAPEAAGSSVQ
jgi:hypothetical protein